MHLPSHLVLSWLVGHRLPERGDRLLIAWAGIAPDLDGLTLVFGEVAYGRWHHTLTHGLVAALAVTAIAGYLARQRLATALLALAAFHLHLVCDLLGSGPQWGFLYLYPFSELEISFRSGWTLVSWQNVAITALGLGACFYTALRHGRTFAEAWLPRRVDAAVVEALRRRFGAARSHQHARLWRSADRSSHGGE